MAATLDVLTLDEGRDAIRANDQTYDTRLAQLITSVSSRMDALLGPIVDRTVTERHDGGKFTLSLRAQPVESITSVTEYWFGQSQVLTAEAIGTIPTYGYLWEPDSGIMFRRVSGWDTYFFPGRRNVQVAYVAGRAATTDLVPSRFKEAASLIVAHVWRNERGSGNQTFGADSEINFTSYSIPRRALELVADELATPGIA